MVYIYLKYNDILNKYKPSYIQQKLYKQYSDLGKDFFDDKHLL